VAGEEAQENGKWRLHTSIQRAVSPVSRVCFVTFAESDRQALPLAALLFARAVHHYPVPARIHSNCGTLVPELEVAHHSANLSSRAVSRLVVPLLLL